MLHKCDASLLAGLGLKATATRFVGVMGLTWAGSQLTKVRVTKDDLWCQPAMANGLLRSTRIRPACVSPCGTSVVAWQQVLCCA